MTTLQSLLFSALLTCAAPLFAETAPPAGAPDVPEIASASGVKGGCEKCKQGGMGKTDHGDMAGMQHGEMDGMACCKDKRHHMAHGGMDGMQHDGRGKNCGGMGGGSSELERRVAELEKRLDLIQQLPVPPRTR